MSKCKFYELMFGAMKEYTIIRDVDIGEDDLVELRISFEHSPRSPQTTTDPEWSSEVSIISVYNGEIDLTEQLSDDIMSDIEVLCFEYIEEAL